MSAPAQVSSDHDAVCAGELDRALELVPFYESWRTLDPGRSASTTRRFAAMPVVSKRDLRAHMPKGFVPRDRDFRAGIAAGDVELVFTSGTTEDRSSIVWHQPWWDRSEHAAAALHAGLDGVINGSQREAVLTTPLCAGNVCHAGEVPVEQRTMGRLLFLNSKPHPGLWTPADMDRMIAEFNDFRPDLLEADPAYLAILARYAADRGVPMHAPGFVSLTYEFPSRVHVRPILRLFRPASVLSSYGSTETGHVFTQCEEGRFHQNTPYCRVDFKPLRAEHGGPRVGRLIVSILHNPWVSLLRFDVGDLARLADGPCPCGRAAGLTLASIEGRVRDLTFATDGRAVPVGRLDAALGDVEGLLAYRLEQTGRAEYCFRHAAEAGHERQAAREGAAHLRALYGGDAVVESRREAAIGAEPSGKFRLAGTRFDWNPAALFAPESLPQ